MAIIVMMNKDESFYWIKHLDSRLAVINVYPLLVPSELPLSIWFIAT